MRVTTLWIVSALLLAGCRSGGPQGDLSPKPIEAEVAALRSSAPRAGQAQLQAVATAHNDFSARLLRTLIAERPGENLVVAPLGLSQDLALLHECTTGKARQTVERLLGLQGARADALAAFHSSLLNDLQADPYEALRFGNAIWLTEAYPPNPQKAKELAARFGCSVQGMPKDLAIAKSQMDKWVSGQTGGRITEIKTPLDSETIALFLNALVFEAQWKIEFDPAKTRDGEFTSPKGTVPCRMMLGSRMAVRHNAEEHLAAAEVPFLGGRYSFLAVMPDDAAGLATLVEGLSGKGLADLRARLSPDTDASLSIPKLDLSSVLTLNDALSALGGRALFVPPLDLSPLAPSQIADANKSWVSHVIQQAKLRLDEKGVKVEAVTEIEATKAADAMPLVFDRPFLYFIVHVPTGVVVVCGMVNDPSHG